MKWKLINKTPQTYAVVLNEGEEVMQSLHAFAAQERLTGGRFSGIGAFSEVMLGHFKPEKRGYKRIPIPEQVEVLSLTGDVTMENGSPQLAPAARAGGRGQIRWHRARRPSHRGPRAAHAGSRPG
ncbi:MAG: DNA-binding protein [Verrucomicrobia bacterium]|nr:DNA-binding protein [Verrucomicrobiota bacterium]